MVVIEKLKHNRFQQVTIPKPIELYKQYGLTKSMTAVNYSGDDYLDPNLSKVDVAKLVSREAFEPAET